MSWYEIELNWLFWSSLWSSFNLFNHSNHHFHLAFNLFTPLNLELVWSLHRQLENEINTLLLDNMGKLWSSILLLIKLLIIFITTWIGSIKLTTIQEKLNVSIFDLKNSIKNSQHTLENNHLYSSVFVSDLPSRIISLVKQNNYSTILELTNELNVPKSLLETVRFCLSFFLRIIHPKDNQNESFSFYSSDCIQSRFIGGLWLLERLWIKGQRTTWTLSNSNSDQSNLSSFTHETSLYHKW